MKCKLEFVAQSINYNSELVAMCTKYSDLPSPRG